jgi:hypothetical protein
MEVKIGVQHAPRELVVDTSENAEELEDRFAKAVSGEGTFSITDTRGRRIVLPARVIAYLEMGTGVVGQVGFRG